MPDTNGGDLYQPAGGKNQVKVPAMQQTFFFRSTSRTALRFVFPPFGLRQLGEQLFFLLFP